MAPGETHHGARDPIGQQPGTFMIHLYVFNRYLWLLVNEFLNLGSLCNFRTSCRLAYRLWVMNEPELVMRWLRHCPRGYVHTFNNRSMERHSSYLVLQVNLHAEAQELGVEPGARRMYYMYYHRNEHFSLYRPTHQQGYRPGTRGRRVTMRPVMPVLITRLRQIVTVWTTELNGIDSVRSVRGEVLHTVTWNQMAESLRLRGQLLQLGIGKE